MEDPNAPRTDSSNAKKPKAPDDEAHLEDVPDGAGCTEIWEHLSATRDGSDTDERNKHK